MTTLYVAVTVLGLVVGSFLNVVIHRVPRGKSIVRPSSRCPSCDAPIRPWHNIPVISYVLLGGRCRNCRAAISPRYPLVEALNGVMYLLVFMRFGPSWALPALLAFVSALIAITFIDLDFQIIPDSITLGSLPLALLAGGLVLPDPFARAEALGWVQTFSGAVTGFVLFYAVAVLSRGGMGGGDIKMMAMVGAVLGWRGVLLTTFLGSLAGSVLGLGLMLFKGKGRKTKIPFGPFLALGTLLSLMFGQEILRWYLNINAGP